MVFSSISTVPLIFTAKSLAVFIMLGLLLIQYRHIVPVVVLSTFEDWNQVGSSINREAMNDRFGWSMALSADGTTTAVGALITDGYNIVDYGHVRVHKMVIIPWNGSDNVSATTNKFIHHY